MFEFFEKRDQNYFFRNWLQKHCNDEWNVHFKALLKRLRNSLTCEGGFRPDHALAPGKYFCLYNLYKFDSFMVIKVEIGLDGKIL